MLKTLTLRSILTYALLDALFAPFVILAFTQLLGTGAASDPMLTLAGLTVAKIVVWAAYLNFELAPWERLDRTAAKQRTPELVQRAVFESLAEGRLKVGPYTQPVGGTKAAGRTIADTLRKLSL